MTLPNLANAISTTLANPVATPDTTIEIVSAAGFPAVPFYIVIDPFDDANREYVKVTARTGTTLQGLTRNLTGSQSTTHLAGDLVHVAFTHQAWDDLVAEVGGHSHSVAHSATTGITTDDHHAEAHTVASHSDTTATGAQLNTLTSGPASDADALHTHPGIGGGAGVTTFEGRSGVVVSALNDYAASEVDNDSSVSGGAGTVADALDALDTGGGFTLAQDEVAVGGNTGLYKTTLRPITPLSYIDPVNHASLIAGTFDCRPGFQDCFDEGPGIPVELPRGIFKILTNNNAYATGHPVLADYVTNGYQIGLIDSQPYRHIYGQGFAGSGATGGVTEFLGNRHGGTMLVSALPLAALIYVDDQNPGSSSPGADQRGGEISKIVFKDVSSQQDQIQCGILVGRRWHYQIHHNSFVRLAREGSIVPIGSGSTLPNIWDLPSAGIMSTTDLAGAETVQYLKAYHNIYERCINGYFMYHDAPDSHYWDNMFYGAQKDKGGDSPTVQHHLGTALFINGLDIWVGRNRNQHTGRGIHVWGRGGKSAAVTIDAESFENPTDHGWSAAERGLTYGLIVDGSNIKGVVANEPIFANGASFGAPIYVDPSVSNGNFELNRPHYGGTSPTGSVANNPNNYWLVDTSRRTVGYYREVLGGPNRHHLLNEGGDVVRMEITGSDPGTLSFKNAWTQGT